MSDFSVGTGDSAWSHSSGSHENPVFDFLSGYVPKKLKSLLVWTEYLMFNSCHIYAALNKLSDYSVTEIIYNTDSAAERSRHKSLMEDHLDIKSVLKALSRDRSVYGNSFTSVFLPFARYLQCSACDTKTNIKRIDYKFKHKTLSFVWRCKQCKSAQKTGLDDVIDTKIPDPRRINIIRWDPKAIDIDYNPITGEKKYYYTIPGDIKQKIQRGNKNLLNTIPKGFLLAIKDKKIFEFADGQLFHLKVDAPAGVDSAWGFPPLTATLKQFYYAAALRKANEAIALDHLVPLRVLHPAQSSGNSDPIMHLSMSRWVDETKDNIKKWRKDPLHIMFSPVALGTSQIGGNGRALMTLGEVEAAENQILACMGIPREFLYGGLSYTGSAVTLRMLENQLLNQTHELIDVMKWIGEKCANFLGWEEVEYDMTPFKLIDDIQQKQILLQLSQQGDTVSRTTMASTLGYDLEKERRLREQETIDEMKHQNSLQQRVQKLQNSLAQQARSQSQMGGAQMQYDQQQIIAAADMIVEQMMQMDAPARRGQLHALKSEDAVMHAVVIQRLQEMQRQQIQQARATVSP
jgi:hypothetical protein